MMHMLQYKSGPTNGARMVESGDKQSGWIFDPKACKKSCSNEM